MKKKVVFFTESMEMMGGMERVVAFLANELSQDYDVKVLTMHGEGCIYPNFHGVIETLDINIIPDSGGRKLKRYWTTFRRLKAYLQRNPDVEYLVANSAALSGSAMLVKVFSDLKVKIIPFEHNKFMFPGKFWRWVRQWTFSKSHRVIALTKDAHIDYLKINSPSVHIPNALSLATSDLSELKHKKLVAVGRLVDQKGFDLLLHAWQEVVKSYPDWQLEIVGDGEDGPMLKSLAEQLGISHNVIFFGQTNHIQERYLDASGFILSSRYEGFCLVMIEAMAHGLPCVSFDCESGPNEVIIEGENGYLVEAMNVSELSAKIKEYIALPIEQKKVVAQNAKATSLQYMPEIIIDRWKKEVLND